MAREDSVWPSKIRWHHGVAFVYCDSGLFWTGVAVAIGFLLRLMIWSRLNSVDHVVSRLHERARVAAKRSMDLADAKLTVSYVSAEFAIAVIIVGPSLAEEFLTMVQREQLRLLRVRSLSP